jgi:hypothetical protein
MTKIKVVCIFGEFQQDKDFVLEPVCSDSCRCDICKDSFWIEKCEGGED